MENHAIRDRLNRMLVGGSLIVAPLVIVAQEWIAPEPGGEREAGDVLAAIAAHPGRYEAAMLLGILAAILLIPALAGLALAIRDRSVLLAWFGGILGVIGAVGFACQNAISLGFLELAAAEGERARMVTLYEGVRGSTAGLVIELLFIGGLFLGLILLAAAVWRSALAPRAAAILILMFLVLDMVLAGQMKLLDVVVHLVLAAGLGWVGWVILWRRDWVPVPKVRAVSVTPNPDAILGG
jgi:hypothetical protein